MASTRNIRGISIEIGGDTTKLENSLKTVYQKSTDLSRELRQVDRALKFNPKNVELTSQKQKILTEQVDNTRKRLNELKSAQAEVTRQYEAGEIDAGQYRAFQRELVETESILKTYERQLSEVSDTHKIVGKAMEEVGGKMQDVGKKISDVGGEMTKKITLPIAGVSIAAGKLGIDFEKSMSEVAAVSGATGEELEQLEKAARDAGSTTDKSARDAADALQYMALAGWDVEDSQQALMPILKLSSAANMDLGRTSDLVTDTMSVLGLEIDDLEGYLDVLAQTSRNSNTDVDQLGESFLVVGGKLTQLGVDVEEGAVALGLLADNGIKGSEAGRGLNAILTNLTAPTGRAKKALEELGISAFDSNGEFIGIEETLQLVADSTEDMTQEQQNMYLSMIAGKEHGKTLNALMGELGGGFDNLSGKVSGADGALEEMYDTATDNTMGAINNLRSAIEELGLKIFDNLQPAIEKAVEFVQKLTDKFNALTPEQQEMIVQIGLMVAAIGPVLVVFGKMISVMGSTIAIGGKLIGSFGSILKVGGVLAKGLGATVGFIFSPAGAIMVGIAAVIAGGVLLWKNWDKVKAFGASLKDSLTKSWNTLKTNTINTWNNIKDGIMNPINRAKDAVKEAIDKMKGFFNFEWKLPKIKMPKFSVSGSANPLNWLKEGPPKLNVSWHASGGILTRPGIFGMLGNTLLAGGEHRTGGEAILPLNRLPQIMADAMERVNRQTQPAQPQVIKVEGNNEDLGQVTSLLTQLLHKSADVYLGKEKVGEIMDNEQGRRTDLQGRVAY